MDDMLRMTPFEPFGNMKAYGLGVQEYSTDFPAGQKAVELGGAIPGTTTDTVYMPDYDVSIKVMIDALPNEGADDVTKGLTRSVLGTC